MAIFENYRKDMEIVEKVAGDELKLAKRFILAGQNRYEKLPKVVQLMLQVVFLLVVPLLVSYIFCLVYPSGFGRCALLLGVFRKTKRGQGFKPHIVAVNQHVQNLLWMNEDHQRRWNHAHAKGHRPTINRFLLWLHIPKTGTSFANTLIRWGCPPARLDVFVVPRKERPAQIQLSLNTTLAWDWLFDSSRGRRWLRLNCPQRLSTTDKVTGKIVYSFNIHAPLQKLLVNDTVAMFRLPLQRTYSNYLHIDRHYDDEKQSRMTLKEFFQKPQFLSQQTKLLLGYDYRFNGVLSKKQAIEASKMIDRLAFVGLTEYFELSVRLFHAKFGGVPHRAQFENVRPSIQRYKLAGKRHCSFRYDEADFGDWKDEPDEIVYNSARLRFWRDVCHFRKHIELDGLGPVPMKLCLVHTSTPSVCTI